ncbi:LysR family transcriptional regulator [Paracoccus seriniphilus]|uniref:Transcriptional regulator, LysR family n=1 Tax=Paracoccus seriniphilus TaxID=184748 RepID=A0A239Q303_9RHOB|nr:LysR family transcriptional regulator [Paracoccus seriniphilus]WCR15941.1 LysR family transcriptional regulator [Paracoccus seriniphilus]SNT76830.1 transcriptional regulator, LysR family [Paracoccus seriniphilus]
MKAPRHQLPSMNALFAFEAAGRHLNFSRAADELNVTPAAVSRMMKRLEEHLGTPLFQRRTAGLSLNENGALLHQATTRAMAMIGAAVTEVESRGADHDRVTLSLSTAFTTHWLMPRMSSFKAEFPNVDLRFQLVMGALTGPVDDVDLGMRFLAPDQRRDGLRVFPIMPEVLLPLCTPAYRETIQGKKINPTMIRLSGGQPLPHDDFFDSTPGAESPPLTFDDYAIVIQAALLGQGICWGWLNVVGHRMRERQLVPALPHVQVTDRICSMLQSDKPSNRPVVEHVRDWMIAQLQQDYRSLQGMYPELPIP